MVIPQTVRSRAACRGLGKRLSSTMSDEGESGAGGGGGACWSSGLSRSYSEHAALVLQHFQQHRRGIRSDAPRCTRSGPDFRLDAAAAAQEADDEDETDEPKNAGRLTWRISSSTSEDDRQHRQQQASNRRRIIEIGCGDSSALTDDFSELSLQQPAPVTSSSSTGQNATTSSMERCCQLFDDDEEFTLIDLDDEEEDEGVNELGREGRRKPEEQRYIHRVNDESGQNPGTTTEADDEPNNNDNNSPSCSTTSLSSALSSRQRLNGVPLLRQISYENWARDKQRELQRRRDEVRRAEQQRLELEERERREREEKERRDYENYLAWLERKKQEKLLKRQLLHKELDLQKRIRDVEDKAKLAKNICLRQWYRKKEEQQKASEKDELMKKKKADEEKERRLQDSLKAYEKWREKAKNTPRPATQGLLPHQKAKPAFTNPTPWQPLVDNASDDSDGSIPVKTFGSTTKNQRSKRTSVRR